MEMADGIVINKADGDNLERAKLAATQFRNALHLFPAPESGWIPKVLTYSGFYNLGVKEVWDMIYEYIDFVKENGYFEYRRNEQVNIGCMKASMNNFVTAFIIIRRLKQCS